MAGIFDLKKGAFDSSEAARLYEAYAIALQGLRASHDVDRPLSQRLARSIVRVARAEPDCLRNDGTIDPVRLAQRAVLRLLQARSGAGEEVDERKPSARDKVRKNDGPADVPAGSPESPSKVMLRIFDGTRFAKL